MHSTFQWKAHRFQRAVEISTLCKTSYKNKEFNYPFLDTVHTNAFSNDFVFVRQKTCQSIRVRTAVFAAFLSVHGHTKTLENDGLSLCDVLQ